MGDAATRLYGLLDTIEAQRGSVSFETLSEQCLRLPHLSESLTGRRRRQLYRGLLLSGPLSGEVVSFRSHATAASESQKAVAMRLKEALGGNSSIDIEELQGFVCHFSAETRCQFDEKMTGITLTMATMLASDEEAKGLEKLYWLSLLLGALQRDFIVPESSRVHDETLATLFRLLLQYHDPALSLHFDHYMVNVGIYILRWVQRLFVVGDNYEAVLRAWDWLFVTGDSSQTVYFVLAFAICHRQQFLSLHTKEQITEALDTLVFHLPGPMEAGVDPELRDGRPRPFTELVSGKGLARNAEVAYCNTPRATRQIIDSLLFSSEDSKGLVGMSVKSVDDVKQYYTSMVTLPLERLDFLETFGTVKIEKTVCEPLNYVILDCRARESFEAARLPAAIHAGDEIRVDSEQINNVTSSIDGARGSHLCVLGTGRDIVEEINMLKFFVLHLVQRGFPYVSCSGFRCIVPLIKANTIHIEGSQRTTGPRFFSRYPEMLRKAGFSDYIPKMEFDKNEAARKAEEVRAKAKEMHAKAMEGMQVAKSWGMGLIQRMGNRLAKSGGAEGAERDAQLLPSTNAMNVLCTERSESGQYVKNESKRMVDTHGSTEQAQPQKLFSLGNDFSDDEDDLDLILLSAYDRGNADTNSAVTQREAVCLDEPEPCATKPATTVPTDSPTVGDAATTGTDECDATDANRSRSVVAASIAKGETLTDEEFLQLLGD
ncbi:Rab GTPase TBC domain [Trypanosoma vivax]|nr:hypothetical protein TRVL_03634 [Trypanosoma vivax]KAH8609017.1 Rab GTPase TBC domain [Trypanosoma vivax]